VRWSDPRKVSRAMRRLAGHVWRDAGSADEPRCWVQEERVAPRTCRQAFQVSIIGGTYGQTRDMNHGIRVWQLLSVMPSCKELYLQQLRTVV
jgi:hypothetical protein